MDYEIKKENWADFFESLSKRRYEWKTKVQILNPEMGDQTLTEGLPLNGVTVETRDDKASILVSIGANSDSHVTHSIADPIRVVFMTATDEIGDVIDIKDSRGTDTLISFIEPMGLLIGYMEVEMGAAAG